MNATGQILLRLMDRTVPLESLGLYKGQGRVWLLGLKHNSHDYSRSPFKTHFILLSSDLPISGKGIVFLGFFLTVTRREVEKGVSEIVERQETGTLIWHLGRKNIHFEVRGLETKCANCNNKYLSITDNTLTLANFSENI